ncbi:MAG: hypothetical protein IKZ09_12160, partial [Clostridia bacterium]|nr:hypothetical protein [Clostridia bacterium]
MILRKTPSVFLRTLRAISPDALPALPTKKLSAAQTKRLENAVFSRIAAEQNTSVFTMTEEADSYDRFDAPYESTPIGGKAAWRDFAKMAVTACLCFALLASVVLIGGKLAQLSNPGPATDTTTGTHISDTEAIWLEPQETGVPYPGEHAEGFSLEIDTKGVHDLTGDLTLAVSLKRDGEPLDGISVQCRRVTLSLWDPDACVWNARYDVYTPDEPNTENFEGGLYFSPNSQGQLLSDEAIITIPHDIRGFPGIWCISLEGLTLVHNSSDPTGTD